MSGDREDLAARERDPGFLKDRASDVVNRASRAYRKNPMELNTYQDDSSPLSSSPEIPSGPALYQMRMISRTLRCVFQGWPE